MTDAARVLDPHRKCFKCGGTKLPLDANSLCETCAEPEEELVGVYPWCSRPELCAGKGYCPRDPNCGD